MKIRNVLKRRAAVVMDSSPREPTRLPLHRRPPPNYFARSVQLRLLVVVSCLMLVLVLMFEARKPENWHWMWAGAIDKTIPAAPSSQPKHSAKRQPPEPYDVVSTADLNASSGDDPLVAVRERACAEAIGRLSLDQRLVLDRIQRASRTGEPVSRSLAETWAPACSALSEAWIGYLADARDSVTSSEKMAEEDRERWLDVLAEGLAEWQERFLPALQVPLTGRPWTAAEREVLDQLQAVVDRRSFAEIQDDTVARADEQHAWFRCFERLQRMSAAEIEQASTGQVGFLQLFQQPEVYRGKLVTVNGTARLAYRVAAPANVCGIEHYLVFWLKPAGGQLAPYLVYALETPAGFPEIKDKHAGPETAALSADVSFTGYFFKRQAYRAQDGVNTAPVLLAKSPSWSPPASVESTTPAVTVVGAVVSVLAVGVLAIVLARLAHGPSARRARVT